MISLSLRAALTRAAWVTATAWPVVLIDFVLDTCLKLALALPALGGGLVMAALVAPDLGTATAGEPRAAVDALINSLASRPLAVASFLGAIAVVGLAGAPVVFAMKAGTLAVLVSAERSTPRPRFDESTWRTVRHAAGFRKAIAWEGLRRFGPRAAVLAFGLGVAYLVVAAMYVLTIGASTSRPASLADPSTPWPALVFMATMGGIVTLALLNLAHDLLRLVMIADDCSVPAAVRRLARFLAARAVQVLGIIVVMGAARLAGGTASLLAAAGLGVIAWLPVVGLAFLPLQAVAWLSRGLLLQYLQASMLLACLTQYRRYSDQVWHQDRAADNARAYLFGGAGAGGGGVRR